jgi:polysaccharide pyruvyl transferase WcaK-like protein
MTKILILNAGNTNKGNRALVHATIETIKNFVIDAEFNLMGPYAVDKDIQIERQAGMISKKLQYTAVSHTAVSLLYLLKCTYINLFKRFGMNITISKNSRLFKYYDCEIVIKSGGDQISGEYCVLTLGTFLNLLYAILLGKPVVLYADSLGYYHNHILDSIAKFVFNRTKLILLREDLSKKWLDGKGIRNPQIYVTADPAFLLTPAPPSHVFEILINEGIHNIQKPIIGINPSGLIGRYMRNEDPEGKEKITDILAKVIDNLIENLNVSIIMVPHVYTTELDDRVAINKIFREVKNKSKVKIIKNEYTPQELKGIIGLCDLFIGTRMHAAGKIYCRY